MKTIAGIRRSPEFSPNSVENDAAIFDAVVAELRSLDYIVNLYEEIDFSDKYNDEKIIFHMARRSQTMEFLRTLEQNGCQIVNSTASIAKCGRLQMTNCLMDAGIPHPNTIILSTSEVIVPNKVSFLKMWVKRSDGYSMCADDICFLEDKYQINNILANFRNRGIEFVVINEHIAGNLVKFYGVSESTFFHWFYPLNENHSKFGQEIANGHNSSLKIDSNYLEEICRKASAALGLDVWGGDAIVSADGKIQIIDFNDFPSFKPCRGEAARAIAMQILNTVERIF